MIGDVQFNGRCSLLALTNEVNINQLDLALCVLAREWCAAIC